MSKNKLNLHKPHIFVILLCIFFIYIGWKNINSSVFLKNRDKVNVVFYGKNSLFYSFGQKSNNNYLLSFSSSSKMLVPGGYGFYRLGSLSKLVSLDKKPDLFLKTFSAATSSFVDLYFYSGESEIFYNEQQEIDYFPGFFNILFYKSNSGFIDRLFLFFKFANRNISNYKIINFDEYFNRVDFIKSYQGTFYKKTNRDIASNVQIIYSHSYPTAQLLADIIDGEGIRVVDISQEDFPPEKNCELVIDNRKQESAITQSLSKYFGCSVVKGETRVSDIILKLGNLERKWQSI